jgi:hypothetical protein
MHSSIDFVSKTTGRIHLHAAFDTASEGLSLKDAKLICARIRRFQKDLQREMKSEYKITLSLDSYEGSVFWYLVLFRPVLFKKDVLFGSRTWSVYEILKSKHRDALGKTDLGVFCDQDRLCLIWPEAFSGILAGFENCPSWKKIIKGKDQSFWRKCADSFSFTIPRQQLLKENYLQGQGFRQERPIKYKDITVLSLSGIDVPTKVGELPVAKRVRFSWFYDKPTMKMPREAVNAQRRQAARVLYSIFKLLKLGRLGRPWEEVSPEKALELCRKAVLGFDVSKEIAWEKFAPEFDTLRKLGGYDAALQLLSKGINACRKKENSVNLDRQKLNL